MKTKIKLNRLLYPGLLLGAVLVLPACSDNDNGGGTMPAMETYLVTVDNLTHGQPMTPLAAVLHDEGYSPWTEGMAASPGLEMLAEGGDPTSFLMEADSDTSVAGTVASDLGPFGPGSSQSVMLTVTHQPSLYLSLASMLANTNDAFTGIGGADISGLAVGESREFMSIAYDAGTEDNTEAMGTIPGPVDGGEGFNAARENSDRVSIHRGIISLDDGLTTSVLSEAHRWLNPVSRIRVERVE